MNDDSSIFIDSSRRDFLRTGATVVVGATVLGLNTDVFAQTEKVKSQIMSLPPPTYAGGTKPITLTPIVGKPKRSYAEQFVPGEEKLEGGELRVTVLGSGNPWTTRAQASAGILVEVGNPQRDIVLFDIGSGVLANYASLKLPVNKLNKVFITHLHADHMSDMLTLVGSYAKVGRSDGPVYVWGPNGSEPRLGTKHFCESIDEALAWDTEGGKGPMNPDSMRIVVAEHDYARTGVVYEKNGVKITSFPVVHTISGAVGYKLDFAGLSFVFSGDARPSWPLVRACEGCDVDLLIHETFPPAAVLAKASGLSIERATIALNGAHTSPTAAAKVFSLVKPKMAGMWHTLLSPEVIALVFTELKKGYAGPIVQTQDFTVFNITKEALVVRQAKVWDQQPPIPGVPEVQYKPYAPTPPAWWKDALIPID
jgi:ribonuclease Z